ncbi:TRAP transporter large permease subunit [Spirochaeta thermophila]|uniref:Transporter n=1 Tax=Winmispira thermophila (strain ATCC 49972 / DSM 6192 / RI 19.B1) TaxID=665571 RepID=E0RQS0_WINT6|nr:TRAP transporter large permease subunit [Spirochaeta thermophila]ADN02976.1 transporter [Spirochaeta thermophila DSM 6192]
MRIDDTSPRDLFRRIESILGGGALLLLTTLPLLEMGARVFFSTGIPGSGDFLHHLVIWVTFFGAMMGSRTKSHLSIAFFESILPRRWKTVLLVLISWFAGVLTTVLALSAVSHYVLAFDPHAHIEGVPLRAITWVIPLGFSVIAARFFLRAPVSSPSARTLLMGAGLCAGLALGAPAISNLLSAGGLEHPLLTAVSEAIVALSARHGVWVVLGLVLLILLGLPLFVGIAGISLFLLLGSWGVPEVVPDEVYTLLTDTPIPPLPLFTLVGFLLSVSKAGDRFIAFFRRLFHHLPGGVAIVAILVSAFFTTFTGASGVAILALGGVLSYVMIQSRQYSRPFTHGLLTASGTIGLLFPPSLPIIIYGSVAHVSIKDLFIGGFIPGLILVGSLIVYSIVWSLRHPSPEGGTGTEDETRGRLVDVVWEVLLPCIIVVGFFSGILTLVETAAFSVVYIFIVEVFITREVSFRDAWKTIERGLPIIGGILLLLGAAKALSYYIVDTQFPLVLTAWMKAHVGSKYLFLLLVTIILLITGCLMDTFSAIMIVAPLLVPLSEAYDIHPVHMGVLFLANLAVGYLTPPVGLNLFLASYRFEEHLLSIYKQVIPFFLVLFTAVLLITYVPALSLGLLHLLGG